MELIEIKLHILYIVFAVIVACEARFHRPGSINNDEEDYDDGETAGVPVTFVVNRMNVPDSETPPKNLRYKRVKYNGWNSEGRYMPYTPTPTDGRHVRYKDHQARKGEISPYPAYLTPPGQYRGMYPVTVYEKANNGKGPSLYNRPLLSPEDMGYPIFPRVSNKDDFTRFLDYDGYQAARPERNKMYVDSRPALHRFRRPTNGQAKMVPPVPNGDSSEWNYRKITPNEDSNPDKYLLFRSIRDNSTARDTVDASLQDNLAQYDSYVDPSDYVFDLKKRFKADYNVFL